MRSLRILAPLVLAAVPLFIARNAPAGPPGPWVFIPPPGSTTGATTATTTVTTTATTATKTTTATTKVDGLDRARVATVLIERGKKPIALGVLLADRPVIITARSSVVASTTGDLEAIFPEGTGASGSSPVKVKLVHEDVAWDLALLVPASTKGAEGAKAADTDPLSSTATFSTFVLLKTLKVQAQTASILGKRDFNAPEGDVLKDALSLDPKGLAIGSPVVDDKGGVVAVVTRACTPGSPKVVVAGKGVCMPQLFGVPLSEIRKFLKSAPAKLSAPAPYIGVEGTADPLGVKITDVKAGSPAAGAGLKATDDVIVAVDGAVVRSADDLHTKINTHSAGDVVSLLVASKGQIREVKVTLKDEPELVTSTSPSPGPSSTNTPTITLPPLPLPVLPPKK